jgi:predicted small metal-binding protein
MEKFMKTMNCNQLGGACEKKFSAETFEEVAQMTKQHGMEMFQKQDEAHLNAMSKMQELMKTPEEMEKWFESKRKEFEALPDS